MPDQNGASRLDRMERLMEMLVSDHVQFADEHKKLLTAQVVLTDRMDKLTIRMDQLAQSQQETTGKLDALIQVVDDFIRKRPPQ